MTYGLLKWGLRLGVSLAMLALVVYLVPDKARLVEAGRGISPPVWLGVWMLFLGGQVAMALKWRLLMGLPPDVPAADCLRGHFAGQASNLFLPGVSGADVVRLLWVVRAGAAKERVILASAVDRFCDLAALLLLAALGAAATAQGSEAVAAALGWVALLLVAAALCGLGGVVFARRLFRHAFWDRLDAAYRRLRSAPGRVAAAAALSLLVQGAYVLGNAALGRAAGAEAPLAAWFVAWPLAKLTALIPVSLAGLGVRDAALVFFLKPLGGSETAVTAAALAWSSVLVAAALTGGAGVVLTRRSAPTPKSDHAS